MASPRKTQSQKRGGWRPGAGRPKLPEADRASVSIQVSVTPKEAEAIKEGTRYMGYRARSPFLRHVILSWLEGEGIETR